MGSSGRPQGHLANETGQWAAVPRDERLCVKRLEQTLEDEMHVLGLYECNNITLEVRGLWHLLLWHIMKCNNNKI